MEKSNKKVGQRYLLISLLLCSVIMTLVDGIIQPGYLEKSLIKIILFLIIPLLYFFINGDFQELKKLFTFKKKMIFVALALGIGVFTIILIAYFLFKDVFDFTKITKNLTDTVGVTKENFIFVAIYISLINSMLEEFFFRGYGFLNLKKLISRKMAYSISAFLFALYHVGMTLTMFGNVPLFILSFIGLYMGGVIFNILNEKFENIYCSWLVHMFCNFGINTIGLILFGIL